MSLDSIAADIRNAVSESQEWLAQAVEKHLPAFAAEAERITSSPIYQEYAGFVLPGPVEAEIALVVRSMVKLSGALPATPAAPVPTPPVSPEPPASGGQMPEPAEPQPEPAA